MNIAYQGVPGSFSFITANAFFGKDHTFIGTKEFRQIFEHLKSGSAQYGVVPVENTLAGSVYENYDHLHRYEVYVIGEFNLKIEHQLLGLKDDAKDEERLKKIKKVYSHIKALEQCNIFFLKHPWIEKVVHSDTAGAAEMVMQKKDLSLAAIASDMAGKLYNLEIIRSNIEDDHRNFTRFLIITNKPQEEKDVNKCSLILTLPHVAGSLYKALGVFASNKMNLTKIESRPILGKPFEYVFYIDLEFDSKDYQRVKKVIDTELKQKTQTLKILGFYKSHEDA